jgi:hypothetical protein
MGVSVSTRIRARALRARFLGPGFEPTDFGQPKPRQGQGDPATFDVRANQRLQHENAQLHATAKAEAEGARSMEKLMERKRWSHG